MLKFLKSKRKGGETPKKTWFSRFGEGISSLLLGKKTLDASLRSSLETLLLQADVGLSTTEKILDNLVHSLERCNLGEESSVIEALKEQMLGILKPAEGALELRGKPSVIVMVGVNGSGKTTSIAKLAQRLKTQNQTMVLAAGDTFRAAAIEQLQTWGERHQVPVVAQHLGADSASVIYDALQSAQAKQLDVLIADTAGRLHTQSHLMEELQKVMRVIKKLDDAAPHEILLTIDATLGQNAMQQAEQFHQALGVTGVVLTKMDGTAKGGMVFAVADKLGLPIKFIGMGEGADDLEPFDAQAFIEAIFD